MSEINKSEESSSYNRKLSIISYFDKLQLEYIINELRRKIYHKKKDKTYYSRVLEQKRQNIEDISSRNKLPSIFNDVNVKKLYYDKIYNEFGLPNFMYRSEAHRAEFELNDIQNYFLVGSEVKFKKEKDNNIYIGTILLFELETKKILIEERENKKLTSCFVESVARIL